ncbi:hypothetical protein DL96DRAFT_1761056 [Flagelloscypha sp. PMI_526]|nr:hypothetical protein DL96DRAFT_1761056 [Flagelloscypha sp. PMI_526]
MFRWVPIARSTVAIFPLNLPDIWLTRLTWTVPFQHAPNLRGTMDIILGCATVLLIAIYTSFHPEPKRSSVPYILRDNSSWYSSIPRNILMILAPELFVFISSHHYFMAKRNTKHFKQTLGLSRWSQVHSHVLYMEHFALSLPASHPEVVRGRDQLTFYVRNGILRDEDLPKAKELRELSKTATPVKLFTIVQILWIIIQCLARWVLQLPVTLLELMTCCYALCAVLTYMFWMDKPYRMDSRPFVIACSNTGQNRASQNMSMVRNTVLHILQAPSPDMFREVEDHEQENIELSEIAPSMVVAFILSGVHFLAWTSVFPTDLEQKIWHYAATCHILSLAVAAPVIIWSVKTERPVAPSFPLWFLLPSWLCRLVLVGLAVSTLRALPAGAYITPIWTTFIPHFS